MGAPKLVNMKLDRKAMEDKYAQPTVAGDAPMYPWGLSLTLDEEALDKLGMENLPDVDGTVTIIAKATVTAKSSNESTDGKRRSVSLQITDLGFAETSGGKKDAEVLFKG